MNRKKKLLLNTSVGLLQQVVTVICGFVLPRFFLLTFGSEVNGLITSISQFLGFITLLEMGIGPVIQANLYKPLSENNNQRISEIVISAERFYRKIAYIFLVYILVLAFLFPRIVKTEFDSFFTISLLIIIAISTIAQYFFGATYQVLLNADQRAYVQMSFQTLAVILNAVIGILLMKLGASIHIVKLISSMIFVLRPLGQLFYVKKHYVIDKKIQLTGEPIAQKWNGFAQHVAATVSSNTSVVILTFFSSLSNISVYSVYYAVANGISGIILSAASGVESFFGNILAKEEKETMNKSFECVEWIVHMLVTILFAIAEIMIIPFVKVYTKGVTDINYILPSFGFVLVLAYMIQCLRIPYFIIIKAAGHFKQTQGGSFIMAGINIIASLLFVFKLGLVGVALGTLLAMIFHICYFVWYLRNNILNRSVFYFVKYVLVDAMIIVVSFFIMHTVGLSELSFIALIKYGVLSSFVVLVVAIAMNLIFNPKLIVRLIKRK